MNVSQLRPQKSLRWNLYHPSGRMLLPAGGDLSASYLGALKRAGVGRLYACRTEDDVIEVRRRAEKVPVTLEILANNRPATCDLFNKQGTLLLPAGRKLDRTKLDELRHRGVTTIYRLDAETEAETRLLMDELVVDVVNGLDNFGERTEHLRLTPDGGPPVDLSGAPHRERSQADHEQAEQLMTQVRDRTDQVLERLSQGRMLHGREVDGATASLLEGLKRDKNLLVGLTWQGARADAFLVSHSVNVSMLSLAIGSQMGLSATQLARLGSAALLHDVGMLTVPSELLYKDGPLTEAERYEIGKHPVRGMGVLEQVEGIEDVVRYAIYQEHERETGGGYPKGRHGQWIADMARIIAVADTFEAMASWRPYREAKLPYDAMAEVIRMAGEGQLHAPTVRALLSAVGLFPLGSVVKLKDGSIGRVVAIDPNAYDKPLISRLRDAGGSQVSNDVIDLGVSKSSGLVVVEAVTPVAFQVEPAEGF